MEPMATRGIAGAGLVFVLMVGGWTASRLTLETADAIDLAMAKQVNPEDAQRKALSEKPSYEDSAEYFQMRIDEAVSAHGVTAPPLQRLREPNTFTVVAAPGDTRKIATGATLREAGIQIQIEVAEVTIEDRGVRLKSARTLARVSNVGDQPLAYFLTMRISSGDCKVRVVNRYDTMALMPKEEAEISICSGEHEIEITALEIMEISELGALWVSKVPPQAVGHNPETSRSHAAGPGISMCAEIPAVDFASRIQRGEVKWEDIVDFYSRHDCEVYRWWPGYTRIIEPLSAVPALPPKP